MEGRDSFTTAPVAHPGNVPRSATTPDSLPSFNTDSTVNPARDSRRWGNVSDAIAVRGEVMNG